MLQPRRCVERTNGSMVGVHPPLHQECHKSLLWMFTRNFCRDAGFFSSSCLCHNFSDRKNLCGPGVTSSRVASSAVMIPRINALESDARWVKRSTVSASFTITVSSRVAVGPVFLFSTRVGSCQRRVISFLHTARWLGPGKQACRQLLPCDQ